MPDINQPRLVVPTALPVQRAGLVAIIRDFTPNWFTVTMGTGITALALNQLPFAGAGLHDVGTVLWLLNILLFVTFSALYAARWVLFYDEARRILGHSVMSMFFGAIPMGLATIINGFLAFGIPWLGAPAAVGIATALWWIDAAMAVVCGIGVPFLMFTRHDHSMEKMTAVWLLPIVAAEVAAASAGQLLPHLAGGSMELTVLALGYALWAFSVPLALSLLVILFLRLVLHKLPHRDMAASGCLALGPIGTGALSLLLLGAAAPHAFATVGLADIGQMARGIGIIGGLALWGYGVWWFLLAVLTTLRYLQREGMPFNLGWWGFTFPLGVYSVATLALAHQTGLALFSVIGTGLVLLLAVLWTMIAVRTAIGAFQRKLFVSPCRVRGSIPSDFTADEV
ncbi:TDT family transporter [Acidisoma cellulosilyticum]|nr:TDT family transporter [Acidisoma cellulosilyticum]